jgi:hypothetical protein
MAEDLPDGIKVWRTLMSIESKLRRLGLWHLRDKPDELEKELKKLAAGQHPKMEAGQEEDVAVLMGELQERFAEIPEEILDECGYWDFTEEEHDTIRDLYYEILESTLRTVHEKYSPANAEELERAFDEEQRSNWLRKREVMEAAREIFQAQAARVFW